MTCSWLHGDGPQAPREPLTLILDSGSLTVGGHQEALGCLSMMQVVSPPVPPKERLQADVGMCPRSGCPGQADARGVRTSALSDALKWVRSR